MFDRITSQPGVLDGKPCIRDTRISVEFILELIASGATVERIIATYPELTRDDVAQALTYAAQLTKNEVLLSTEIEREAS